MDKKHLDFVWNELGKAMFNVEMLREASWLEWTEVRCLILIIIAFMSSFPLLIKVLDGTSYDEVCAKIKDVFVNNYREKSAFFSNQQKFPVYYTQLWGGGAK